jgi:hypothetical protein
MIDCSGSMSGSPIKNARTLAYMLSKFAEKGLVEGNVILTGVDGKRHESMTFKMPMSEKEISSIIASGSAEGIAPTIKFTRSLLQKADYNFCFTDGCISDTPLTDTKGLNLLAMYVGDTNSQTLSKWFEQFISRETLEELVQKLIIKL